MRSHLPSFEMKRARSLEEALELVAAFPGVWRPFAGGTDLMVLLAAGTLAHRHFVSIWGIEELRRIEIGTAEVSIGALATFSDVLQHETLRAEFPLLCLAATEIGGIANQNRATIGGNIANASPAADAPPALLVYDAELELASVRGRRRVPYEHFHTGYKQLDLHRDEVIARICLPRRTNDWVQQYRKVGARRAQAISKLCFAGAARIADGRVLDLRLAFGSVAPTVVRASRTEGVIRGGEMTPSTVRLAVDSLPAELAPIDDIRSTARYRRLVAQNLLREFLLGLARSAC
jgi:CO/xanthine dehydrogenase FAD-binding subunit